MEKLTSYFILLTGGALVWRHFNRHAIKNYLLYGYVFAFVAVMLSIFVSSIFYTLFFLFTSLFLIFVGVSTFYSEKVKNYILNGNSNVEDAKYTLFFLIYIGVFGLLLTMYTLLNGSIIKV